MKTRSTVSILLVAGCSFFTGIYFYHWFYFPESMKALDYTIFIMNAISALLNAMNLYSQ